MALQQLQTFSAPKQQNSEQKQRMAFILERVGMMLDCYPERADAPGALGQASALASVLADYPDEIIRKLTDPARGMPVRQKWRPLPYELKQACEEEVAPLRRQAERDRRAAESARLLAAPEQEKPTLAELKERYGDNWGIGASTKAERERLPAEDEIQARYEGVTIEASDALKQNLAEKAG